MVNDGIQGMGVDPIINLYILPEVFITVPRTIRIFSYSKCFEHVKNSSLNSWLIVSSHSGLWIGHKLVITFPGRAINITVSVSHCLLWTQTIHMYSPSHEIIYGIHEGIYGGGGFFNTVIFMTHIIIIYSSFFTLQHALHRRKPKRLINILLMLYLL